MKSKWRFLAVIIAMTALTEPAISGGNYNNHGGNDEAWSNSESDATAIGVGVGIGHGGDGGQGGRAQSNAQGGHSNADATATARGGNQHQGQDQSTDVDTQVENANVAAQQQSASAVNEGNSISTEISSSDRAYAVGLSSATAAPVDSSLCRVKQTAGWDVRIVARSGRNIFDEACMATLLQEQLTANEHARCLDITSLYMEMGRTDAAMQQLSSCGGVEYLNVPEQAVTHEQVSEIVTRAFEASQEK